MALSALDFPTDIRWERVCVSRDMLDVMGTEASAPPLWQSSMAVFRFVPEAEYQLYPNRRIVYFKVTCTICSYQLQANEVKGAVVRAGVLTDAQVLELDRKLEHFHPCTGAILQITVTPNEKGVKLDDYPYILDVQPKQRALYEQATDSKEVASRSLESLNITKGGGASNSQEVLDIDKGVSVSGQAQASGSAAGVGAGVGLGGSYTKNVEAGTRTLGQQNRSRVETTDSVREARESSSHTTQLTQMYTLLQSYHVGTNRVMFYVSPRPHVLEKPSGFIRGPREIDGVQDFFLIVNQAESQKLPCLSVRLDTGHLTIEEDFDHDFSEPPKELSVDALGLPPGELDPNKIAVGEGSDPVFSLNYDCYESPPQIKQDSATAKAGYVVHSVADIGAIEVNRGSTELVIDPPPPKDGRSVTLIGKATGHACHRNSTGDASNNLVLSGFGGAVAGPAGMFGGMIAGATGSDAPEFPEVKNVVIGYARRTVRVHWRSEAKTKSMGKKQVLLVTTRVLHCCDEPSSTPPKIVAIVSLEVEVHLGVPPRPEGGAQPGDAPGMTARAANELAALVLAETARVASGIDRPADAPALDAELAFAQVAELALVTPRLKRLVARPAKTIEGLEPEAEKRLTDTPLAGSPAGVAPSRLAVASTPTSALAETLGIDRSDALQLRLAALGLGKAPRAGPSTPSQRRS